VTHDAEKLPGHLLNGNWHHIAITSMRNIKDLYYVDGQIATNVSAGSSTWKDGSTPHGAVHFADTTVLYWGAGTSSQPRQRCSYRRLDQSGGGIDSSDYII